MLEVEGKHGVVYPTLISHRKELALVDTGYPLEVEAVKQAIDDAGFSADKLTCILLTHQDLDHIGCAKELAELSGAQVGAHEDEAPYIQGDKTPVKLARREALLPTLNEEERAWVGTMRAAYDKLKLPVDLWLKDGEVLPVCGGIEVIHTPGHTPGHTCFYVARDETLIAGDALNMREGSLTGPAPQHTVDLERAVDSNARLAQYEINHTITYHSGLFEGDLSVALREME